MYKPFQISAPQNRNAKNPPLSRPSEYKPPPGGLYLEFALKYKVKQSKNGKFPSHYKLAQSNLKRKFPSVHKPLEKQALQKGPLKNISPVAYFRNFAVFLFPKNFSSVRIS